jgi:hypothetical protein
MATTKRWNVDILIDEHDGSTRAEARLEWADTAQFTGTGTARRNPRDVEIPEIGDELAASRALSDLAHQLLDAAAADIEASTRRPVHLEE